MRSETQSSAWPAIPVRADARSHRVLNLGQLIRSLVFAALGFALVVALSLQPARSGAGANAPHDSAAARPLTGQSIFGLPL